MKMLGPICRNALLAGLFWLGISPQTGALGDMSATAALAPEGAAGPDAVLDRLKNGSTPELRAFLQAFPKGGDLHNHLDGAIYAETLLEWAAEDGLCVDPATGYIKNTGEVSCADSGFVMAESMIADEDARRKTISALSMKAFVPRQSWSGHSQFFSTFSGITYKPERFGDALAEVAARAGRQNIQYLEIMHTIILGDLIPLGFTTALTGDPAADYQTIMSGPFGSDVETYLTRIETALEAGYRRKDDLLGCEGQQEALGCDVEINIIHQVIRAFEPATVYAQIILGWEAMKRFDKVVALNLVAPEDGYVALRDYRQHMAMIDHLYQTQGPRNVTLHAGELTLGLVHPKDLTFHIRDAVETGHAKRIGHGIDIAFEDDHAKILKRMAGEGIMVEINLTSNDGILGIKGKDHPLSLYRAAGVPFALSTDDEGVSRGDLTHEYMRGVLEQNLTYADLVASARSALSYSFADGTSLWDLEACSADLAANEVSLSQSCKQAVSKSRKAQLQWAYERRLTAFEADFLGSHKD